MKIAVNTRLLLKDRLEGIGWVAYETLRRMVKSHPEVEFYFLFDRQPDPMFVFADNVKPVVLFPQARHPFLYIWYFELSVKRALDKIKPDVFFSPDGYLSLRSDVPQVTQFHDLNFEHFPNDMPKLALWHYKRFFPRYARKAKRIVTVSEFSKQDIVDCYHVDDSKIDVAYNGVNNIFVPISDDEKAAVRSRYTDGKPYFMFVGSLHPRKNLARLFAAFDKFKTDIDNDHIVREPSVPCPAVPCQINKSTLRQAQCAESTNQQINNKNIRLVIVGEKRWWTEPIQKAYDAMSHKDDVVFTGRLSAEDLHLVTASALASVYVSYFEGFGIPIVEAFRCGTPVVTSNVTSMPEVAGDAAVLVDPFDVDSIAEGMRCVLDGELRKNLIDKGFERARLFSWDKAAVEIWNCLEDVVKQ